MWKNASQPKVLKKEYFTILLVHVSSIIPPSKVLEEIKGYKVPKAPKNQEQQQVPETLADVRNSIRLSRPPKRFSPSLYYLLVTDSSEP